MYVGRSTQWRRTLEFWRKGRMTSKLEPPAPVRDQLGEDPDDLSGDQVHDDFKREMKFYRLAQGTVTACLPRLQSMSIKTRRPDDYFAEMAKSDVHMKKVRQKILSKQMSAERSEKAKKMRELRKYGKKVQQEVLLKRQKEKKEMIESVKKYRKGQAGAEALSFLDDNKGGKGQQKGKDGQKNPKREFKNKKFGFGGQKKRSKLNTKESMNDMSSFNPAKHSNRKGKKMGNKNRPGKSKRTANKNKK